MAVIQSMTAFARQTEQGQWGALTWEIRAVNHRYLDVNIYLPETLRELEEILREKLREILQRGKIECNLRYQPGELNNAALAVNMPLVRQLVEAAQKINIVIPDSRPLSVIDVLRWPRVVETAEVDLEAVKARIMTAFDAGLQKLIATRQREGAALSQLIVVRLAKVIEQVKQLKPKLPEILQMQKDKILQRIAEAKVQLEEQRIEQEIVLIAQKSDIAEELDRLLMHGVEVQRVLQQGGSVGRRLDFLMQELNREANTLAAKSNHAEVTNTAVELKVLIEQMREQIQDIE